MTKGLVRANNFSDIPDREQAVINLGLASADYAALKGLYTTAGIDFSVVGNIANSTDNYQDQLDNLTALASGIVLSGLANKQGNSTINGSWSNSGGFIAISGGLPSGYPAATSSLFSLSIVNNEALIVASGLTADNLSYNSLRQSSNTVAQAAQPNNVSPLLLIPTQVNGQSFFFEAGELPSFHIAPAKRGHALDLITGNLLGTYNSATPAMAVGADGLLYAPAANAPVIEYDAATRACLGARIWGATTNLLIKSEEFNDAAWTKQDATITSNVATAPNGASTADKLVENTVNAAHLVALGTSSLTAGQSYTVSCFIKAAERTFASIGSVTTGQGTGINLTTGELTNVAVAGWTNASIRSATNYGNGWWRVSVTISSATGNNSLFDSLRIFTNNGTSTSYAGDGTSGIYVWGAQLTTGSTLAPYVPTGALSASSTADVWSITGADFSRIYNQAAVTMYAEAQTQQSGVGAVIVGSSTGSFASSAYLVKESNNVLGAGPDAAPSNLGISLSAISSSINFRTALAFDAGAGSASAAMNGGAVVSDSSTGIPTSMSQIVIGSAPWNPGTATLNGYIRELAIFRSRRPNANLTAMTQ